MTKTKIESKLSLNQMAEVFDNYADAMEEFLRGHNKKVNIRMGNTEVLTKKAHFCGTPACVGGWLALLSGLENCKWTDGANEFAMDLGFKDLEELIYFFDRHNALWGNKYALNMFRCEYAYDEDGFLYDISCDHFDMKAVIWKWRRTAERLRNADV